LAFAFLWLGGSGIDRAAMNARRLPGGAAAAAAERWRVDSLDKVKGATQFGIDVRLRGMKVATVKACPAFGGKLAAVDNKKTRAVPGVVDVIRISNAVAVGAS